MPGIVAAADSEAVHVQVYCAQFDVSFGVYVPQLNPPDEVRLAETVNTGVPAANLAQNESSYVPFIKTNMLSV